MLTRSKIKHLLQAKREADQKLVRVLLSFTCKDIFFYLTAAQVGRAWRRYAVTLSKPYPLTLWNRWNNEKKVRVSEKER